MSRRRRNMGSIEDLPIRIDPGHIQGAVNEAIVLNEGEFFVRSPLGVSATFQGSLELRWQPTVGIVLEGTLSSGQLDMTFGPHDILVQVEDEPTGQLPMTIFGGMLGPLGNIIKAMSMQSFTMGAAGHIDRMRFLLVNFPQYLGTWIRHPTDESAVTGRLELISDRGALIIDNISESHGLARVARDEHGYVITHVGEWIPSVPEDSSRDMLEICGCIGFWLAFMRGAWVGPVLPEAYLARNRVWRQMSSGRVSSSAPVRSWLPLSVPLDAELNVAFGNFERLWFNDTWNGPLKHTVSWYVEANRPSLMLDSRIVLTQIALEQLAWVKCVDGGDYNESEFEKLGAGAKIRCLLRLLRIESSIPPQLDLLYGYGAEREKDGPDTIVLIRNTIAHSNPAKIRGRTTLQQDRLLVLQCRELAKEYLELAVLAICEYQGPYRSRTRVDPGQDVLIVPWADTGPTS